MIGGVTPPTDDQIKMRDYMDRRITRLSGLPHLPSWGPPPQCKQALNRLCGVCELGHNGDFKIQRRDRNKNERQKYKRKNWFNKQNNNFARVSHFFVHFFAVSARLRRENAYFAFYGERKQASTKFYFSFWTWIWSLGIQL